MVAVSALVVEVVAWGPDVGGGAALLAVFAGLLAFAVRLYTAPTATSAPPVGRPRSRTIPQWVKIAVATRDGGKCRWCGSAYELQYDHVVPYSHGGSSDDVSNIQLLCGRCNRLKSNRYVG